MSSYDDGDSRRETRARRIILERQERLENVLDMFSQRAASVELTPQMKREIAVHIVNYHRVLSNYHDETVLDEGDIPDISPIRQRLGRTTRVVTNSGRRGGGQRYDDRPAVDELDFWYLEDVASELEGAAKKLGFWAAATDTTEHDDLGHGDLAHLLEQRGQDEALEKIPGGDA